MNATKIKSNIERLLEATDNHLYANLIGGAIDANDQVTAFLRAFAVCGCHSLDRKQWEHGVVVDYLDTIKAEGLVGRKKGNVCQSHWTGKRGPDRKYPPHDTAAVIWRLPLGD